jgi:hypothetical protein
MSNSELNGIFAAIFAALRNVRFWHKADIAIALNHVRFSSSFLFDGSSRATQIKNEGQFISPATLQEPHIWQRSQVDGLTMSV